MTALWVGMALLAGWWALRLWLRVPPYRHAPEAPEQPVETPLSRGFARLAAAHPELSGVQLLADGPASLAVRILLARKAQHRLDLQYYIWRDDVAGLLLLDALQDAAARGVRVRLMIDDYGMRGLDSRLKILAAHPNAEVRLFNPHRLRRLRFPNYLVDLPRLNRRMHNKVFLVDDAAAILGGRNIGDEYFDPGNTAFQADLDMLVIGAVMPALTADFARYWRCGSAVPLDMVVKAERTVPPGRDNDTLHRAYEAAVREGRVGEFFDDTDDFQWAPMTLFSDDPAKGLGRVAAGAMMADQLEQALLPVQHSLVLVTAYFVPMQHGIGILSRLARAGVAVDILTNSLQTNNALPTHAGYAPARKPLLLSGVRLWELRGRADAPVLALPQKPQFQRWWKGGRLLPTRASVLHVKALTADNERVFIGSMNFDPRSWSINTEIGLLIDHPALARRLQDDFLARMQSDAWRVTLVDGRLHWRGDDGTEHHSEPQAAWHWRLATWLIARLPVQSQL